VTVLSPGSKSSPFKSAPWNDVWQVISDRLEWEGLGLSLNAFCIEQLSDNGDIQEFTTSCHESEVFLAVDVNGDEEQRLLETARKYPWRVFLVLDSKPVRVPLY
jgi:hypothetical protein